MFDVNLRINGMLVGSIYGRNITHENLNVIKEDTYRYDWYEPEISELVHGVVTHERKKGIRKLIQIILDDIDKQVE